MGTDVAATKSNLPAHLQSAAQEPSKEFSGGVQSGFPVLSYRGKVWRIKSAGEEQVYVNENDEAIQTIEAILVRSNAQLSKTYYKGKYSEGDKDKPVCWSSTGVRPDEDVPTAVNTLCDSCPMNQWGSRTSDEGKKMKACQDVRRTAIMLGHELEAVVAGEKTLEEADTILLRIPPASLNPLKEYAERILAPKGAAPYMLITKIGFDTDASYPRLTFKGARWLSEDEFRTVEDLRESDMVKRIIDTSAEHVTEGSTDDDDDVASSASTAKAEVSESAPSGASNEEELNFSEEAEDDIAPAPTRAAAVEEEAATDTIEQPPQPKAKPKAKPKAVAKPPKKEKAPVAESPGEGDDSDIDDMLSSILD